MSVATRFGLADSPLYIMDGTAFLFRSYYAAAQMQRADGFPTGALYILTRLLLKILKEEKPTRFVLVMDGPGPNFRHELYPPYKAQRSATPEALIAQIDPARELIQAMGIKLLVSSGCEADDCIASLAARYQADSSVVIIGADKDLLQCLTPKVMLWDPASKEEKITTLETFRQSTGLNPEQWPDFQAIIGDSSDNIPGIPGIGPKTADTLFKDFPNLESLAAGLTELNPKMQAKIKNSLDAAFLYRKLTTLSTSCCPAYTQADLELAPPNLDLLMELLKKYELFSLLKPVHSLFAARAAQNGPTAPNTEAGQLAQEEQLNKADRLEIAQAKASSPQAKTNNEPENLPLFNIAEQAQASVPSKSATAAQQVSAPAARQMSLLDLAQKQSDAFADLPAPAPKLRQIEDLPDFNQAEISLLAADGFWHIALRNTEFKIAASPASLPAGQLVASPSPSSSPSVAAKNPNSPLAESENDILSAAPGNSEHPANFGSLPAMHPNLLARLATAKCIVTPDVKTLLLASTAWQIVPQWFDLGLAAYLLNPEERDYSWNHLAARWARAAEMSPDAPALLALRLKELFTQRLQEANLTSLLQNLELPLIPVLAQMQRRGITLDLEAFSKFLAEVEQNLEQLTEQIYSQVGEEFNIRSSQQLQHMLFDKLGLPKAGKTKGGALSTSQTALEKLAGKHTVIDTLLDYRKLEKMRSTYLEPFPRLVDAAGRLHTCFNQLATATGRLSSSNPNLQNIPVRGGMGQRMRACFIASPGKLLVSADYSQIELRVLAHLSQDPALLEAFRNNEDIHRRTASLLFEKPQEAITPEERRNAKTINFGLIYGMGAQKLARELKIKQNQAKEFIDRYFEKLSTLKQFYDSIVARAYQDGFVSTMAGRRRLIPEIYSGNAQDKAQAERQAINTVIQGSAADIIKIAMLNVSSDPTLNSLGARLILQVHDELLLEAPASTAKQAGQRLAEIMCAVNIENQALSVPLLVDWGSAANWGDAR